MPQTAIDTIDVSNLPAPSKYAPKYTSLQKIIELRDKGLSQSQIAKLVGCSREAICQRLQRNDLQMGPVKEFVSKRAEYLAQMQWRLLDSITDTEIQKMAPDKRIWSFGVIYDKERLETGQSTGNIAVIIDHIESLQRQVAR